MHVTEAAELQFGTVTPVSVLVSCILLIRDGVLAFKCKKGINPIQGGG